MLPDGPAARVQQEVAALVDAQAIDAREGHHDLGRVGAGGDEEVVLELTIAPVVLDVDAFVDARRADALEALDVAAPGGGVRAAVVVGEARQRAGAAHVARGASVDEGQTNFSAGAGGVAVREREARAAAVDRHFVLVAPSGEADAVVELSVVPLEGEREACEQIARRPMC